MNTDRPISPQHITDVYAKYGVKVSGTYMNPLFDNGRSSLSAIELAICINDYDKIKSIHEATLYLSRVLIGTVTSQYQQLYDEYSLYTYSPLIFKTEGNSFDTIDTLRSVLMYWYYSRKYENPRVSIGNYRCYFDRLTHCDEVPDEPKLPVLKRGFQFAISDDPNHISSKTLDEVFNVVLGFIDTHNTEAQNYTPGGDVRNHGIEYWVRDSQDTILIHLIQPICKILDAKHSTVFDKVMYLETIRSYTDDEIKSRVWCRPDRSPKSISMIISKIASAHVNNRSSSVTSSDKLFSIMISGSSDLKDTNGIPMYGLYDKFSFE